MKDRIASDVGKVVDALEAQAMLNVNESSFWARESLKICKGFEDQQQAEPPVKSMR